MQLRDLAKRLAPFLTAYLLLVSVGLPLNRVYCACVGEAYLTVTSVQHDCHHDAVETPPHHHAEAKASCCSHDAGPAVETCKSHDCGDSEAVFAQLDVDFFAEWNLDFSTVILGPAISPVTSPTLFSGSELELAAPIRGPDPPPLPYGRSLLALQQTFLI
ncbi:hypothetical protein [Lewinella sp. 4G2]|uniref:hypothetical protein n=1 Tax=Lewinella sp. 4G2 TaxID=1803372 RepID=UPI0007B45F7B|nr:hypothetical protein [Lewinella sp. 4G2]OAV44552.1 hypothetical protein A3850_008635 [Lewinella sp. 4G2]